MRLSVGRWGSSYCGVADVDTSNVFALAIGGWLGGLLIAVSIN